MNKCVYVTFRVGTTDYCKTLGYKPVRFAIKCQTMEQAKEAASTINGFDGISYLRINQNGRVKGEPVPIAFGSDYDKAINEAIEDTRKQRIEKNCGNCSLWNGGAVDLASACNFHHIIVNRAHWCRYHEKR